MSVITNGASELKAQTPTISKRELSPLGVPKTLILILYCLYGSICALIIAVVAPFVDLAVEGGALSWTGLSEEQIVKDLCGVGSMAFTISYITMAVFGLLSDAIPFQVVSLLSVLVNVYALIVVFFTSSTFMVKSGIIVGMQGLVFTLIFVYQLAQLFPKHFNMISAVVSMGSDLSYAVTTLVSIIVTNTSLSVKTCIGILIGLIGALGVGIVLVTPSKWTPYANAQKYNAGYLSYDDYQNSKLAKPKEGTKKSWNPLKNRGSQIVFNPEHDPLYHSFTKQRQIYFNKHTALFTCWYVLHYLRGKKLVQPYLKVIMFEKGTFAGVSEENIQFMFKLWNILPAIAGFLPNLGFAWLADVFGQIKAWWCLNIICSFLFVIIRYLPWSMMYGGAAIVVIENSLMFSLIPMFFGKQFGAHNITKPMAVMYLCMALVSVITDLIQTKMTEAWFNGSYLNGTLSSIIVSAVSVIPITILLFTPFPGPPGADWKDPATALIQKKTTSHQDETIAKVEA